MSDIAQEPSHNSIWQEIASTDALAKKWGDPFTRTLPGVRWGMLAIVIIINIYFANVLLVYPYWLSWSLGDRSTLEIVAPISMWIDIFFIALFLLAAVWAIFSKSQKKSSLDRNRLYFFALQHPDDAIMPVYL